MRALILLICAGMLFAGCSEDLEPRPLTYSRMLTGEKSKTWKLVGFQPTENGRPQGTFQFDPNNCAFDDLYIFYADDTKTFIIDEGLRKCNPEDPQIFLQDTWLIVNATATIEMVIPVLIPFRFPYILRDLDEDSMIVEVFFDDAQQSYRMIFNAVSEE